MLSDRPGAAAEDLSLALRLRPGWPRAHYLRGFAHKACGDLEAAASDFQAASIGDSDLRVDLRQVYHAALSWDALLDEAGWEPLPSVLQLASEGHEARGGEGGDGDGDGDGGGGGEGDGDGDGDGDEDRQVHAQLGDGGSSEAAEAEWVATAREARSVEPAEADEDDEADDDDVAHDENGTDADDDEDGVADLLDASRRRTRSLGARLAHSSSNPRYELDVRTKSLARSASGPEALRQTHAD